jgi:beta-1,4-N-acetylglucosaminyltransferase
MDRRANQRIPLRKDAANDAIEARKRNAQDPARVQQVMRLANPEGHVVHVLQNVTHQNDGETLFELRFLEPRVQRLETERMRRNPPLVSRRFERGHTKAASQCLLREESVPATNIQKRARKVGWKHRVDALEDPPGVNGRSWRRTLALEDGFRRFVARIAMPALCVHGSQLSGRRTRADERVVALAAALDEILDVACPFRSPETWLATANGARIAHGFVSPMGSDRRVPVLANSATCCAACSSTLRSIILPIRFGQVPVVDPRTPVKEAQSKWRAPTRGRRAEQPGSNKKYGRRARKRGYSAHGGIVTEKPIGTRRPKVALVAAAGGHLTELLALRSAFDDLDHFFVLNEPTDFPTHGATVYTVAHAERDWRTALNLWEFARIFRRERPTVMLSTGSGIAVPAAIVARTLGARVVFVETVAAVTRPTLTAVLMQYHADVLISQWPRVADQLQDSQCVGSLFECS